MCYYETYIPSNETKFDYRQDVQILKIQMSNSQFDITKLYYNGKSLLDYMYPIGCVMIFENGVNPNKTIKNTTWEELKNGYYVYCTDADEKNTTDVDYVDNDDYYNQTIPGDYFYIIQHDKMISLDNIDNIILDKISYGYPVINSFTKPAAPRINFHLWRRVENITSNKENFTNDNITINTNIINLGKYSDFCSLYCNSAYKLMVNQLDETDTEWIKYEDKGLLYNGENNGNETFGETYSLNNYMKTITITIYDTDNITFDTDDTTDILNTETVYDFTENTNFINSFINLPLYNRLFLYKHYTELTTDETFIFSPLENNYNNGIKLTNEITTKDIQMITTKNITFNDKQINNFQDYIFPIGYVMMFYDMTDPNIIFPGTKWERIKGKFINVNADSEEGGETTDIDIKLESLQYLNKEKTIKVFKEEQTFTANNGDDKSLYKYRFTNLNDELNRINNKDCNILKLKMEAETSANDTQTNSNDEDLYDICENSSSPSYNIFDDRCMEYMFNKLQSPEFFTKETYAVPKPPQNYSEIDYIRVDTCLSNKETNYKFYNETVRNYQNKWNSTDVCIFDSNKNYSIELTMDKPTINYLKFTINTIKNTNCARTTNTSITLSNIPPYVSLFVWKRIE